ncbi:MAG: diguanylate cyclase [Sideroxydans sp.]|jgi:diguanylate cyclase (GGDEF)-like protein/hemerythrin-like metal-binding protein
MPQNKFFDSLRESADFFRSMIHVAPLPMLIVSDGQCVYGNERFHQLHECDIDKCDSCGLEKMLHERDWKILTQTIASLEPGEVARLPLQLNHGGEKQSAVDLAISCMTMGEKTVALGVINQRSEKERIRRLMDRLAFHDTLTELPNRVLLFDRINQSLSRFNRESAGFAIAILDLDGFKQINDARGHAAGDMLLQIVAKRLTECVRNVDTVSRLGGDEFALILQGVNSEDEAEAVLAKVIAEVSSPIMLEGVALHVGVSIGIAFCPHDGASIQELLCRADFAMYEAKRAGGSCYRISTGQMAEITSRHDLTPLIDSIKLGFDIIDEQHEEIVSCIRGILRSLSGNEGESGLRRRSEYLLQLTEEHFRTEEELVLRYALRDQERHRFEHKELLRQLHELLPGNSEPHGLTLMSHSFKDWLVPHIKTTDTELVVQLKAAGATGR